MENSIKEEFNLSTELKRQQELIGNAINITDMILQALRGVVPKDDCDCMKEECILDALKINGSDLSTLERNLNEILRKVIG